MKKQLLALSIITALSACDSSNDDNTMSEPMAPEFSGEFSAVATKAMNPSGTVIVTDGNVGESLFYSGKTEGTFGSFSISAAGEWQYTLDKSNETVVALVSSAMDSLVEPAFTLTTADGTTTSFSITIDGIDVPATFTGDISNKKVEFDSGNTSGKITVKDANPAEAMFAEPQADTDATGMYGAVTFDPATGNWTYDLDETNPAVKALTDSTMTLVDVFTVSSFDGTQAEINITIVGSDPVPAVVEGVPVDDNGEATTMVNVNSVDAAGSLTITDPNFEQAKFQVQDAVATSYGTFSIDEAGAWTYTLNKTNAEVVALKGNGSAPTPLMESIKVMSVDGTAVDIPITVNGLVGGNLTAQVGGGTTNSIFRIDMPDAAKEAGKMSFKVNYAASGSKDANIRLFGRSLNSDDKRTMAALSIRANGEIKLMDGIGTKTTFALDQTHTPGQWFDLAFTWDATAETKAGGYPKISLSINGTPVTSAGGEISGEYFDSLSITKFIVDIGVHLMEFSTNGESGGAVNVDDMIIYSDVAGTTAIYTENFDSLPEGAQLVLDIANSATTETTVAPLAKP